MGAESLGERGRTHARLHSRKDSRGVV